jgi:hypothetical protein
VVAVGARNSRQKAFPEIAQHAGGAISKKYWYAYFVTDPKLGVAHVPECRRVFPGLTVRENILLGGSNRARAWRRGLETDVEQMFVAFPELKLFANVLGWKNPYCSVFLGQLSDQILKAGFETARKLMPK